MREIRIERNDAGQRLDKFLHRYLREATNGFLYKMLRKKNIKLNGGRAEGRELLSEGDVVTLYLSDETVAKFRGEQSASTGTGGSATNGQTGRTGDKEIPPLRPEEILYEDEDVLIFVKPAGELSQKAKPEDISINERMLAYLKPSADFTPGICNRLDRNTAGILLAGKTLPGTRILSELIRERRIRKYYLTTVENDFSEDVPIIQNQGLQTEDGCGIMNNGVLSENSDCRSGETDWVFLHGYLTKDEKTNRVTVFDKPGEGRSEIHTAYRILETIQDSEGQSQTRLEVELITGKTHQIRAHLASIGHPLVGDRKYGSLFPGPYDLTAWRVIFPDDEQLSEKLRGRTICLEE